MSDNLDEDLLKNKREREESNKGKRDPRRFLERAIGHSERRLRRETLINKKMEALGALDTLSIKTENKNNIIGENFIKETTTLKKVTEQIQLNNIPKLGMNKLLMDEFGRVVDEKGNIIQIKPEAKSTLKVNINIEKEQRVKQLLKTQKIDQIQSQKTDSKFFDPNLESNIKKRERIKQRAFNFAEQGSFLKNIEDVRKRQNAKVLGIDLTSTQLTQEEEKELLKLDMQNIRPNFNRQPLQLKTLDLIPDVEWWDAYFLPQEKKSFSPYWTKDDEGNWIHNPAYEIKLEDFKITEVDILKNKITHYIQHPIKIKNEIIEKANKVILPVFLTEKEKKKLRRLRRLEKEKDKQEKMKLGLIETPPPKLKFNNFMRILGDQAIQDPSQVEKLVRKAYEERYKKMMQENENKKLTKEQKSEKVKRKFEKDSKKEVRACLFKIENLTQRKIRFKIDRNATQLYLNGICLMTKKNNPNNLSNLVYVEGGPLAIKKFKNLLLRRLIWKENEKTNEENEEDVDENMSDNNLNDQNDVYPIKPECLLVWEGTLKNRLFEKWKMTEIKTENEVRKILSEKGIEHYWNLVVSFKIDKES